MDSKQPRQGSLPCTLRIDPAAIAENLATLRGNKEALCMVKADAYGLGLSLMAPLLYDLGVRFFGVAFLQEALALKRTIGAAEILLLFTRPEDVATAVELGLQVVVDDLETLEALESLKKRCKVHLHLNCGMNRLGCAPSAFAELVERVQGSKYLQLEGVMTHLPCAENLDLSRMQLRLFHHHIQGLNPRYIHAANSAAALSGIDRGCTMVRLGLGLYGIETPLKHALTLESAVVKIHAVSVGEGVSYGQRFIAKRPSRVAVVPLGYADGLPWGSSEKLQVRIEGMLLPQIGAIAMDFFMVDVTDCPAAKVGSKVTLFDEELTLGRQAKRAHFLPYELLTRLSSRVSRSLTLFNLPVVDRH